MAHPFIPCPGVAQVECHFVSNGKPCMNVYHCKADGNDGPLTLDDLSSVWTDFFNWEDSVMQGARNLHTQLEVIKVRDLTEEGALALERSDGMPIIGTDTSDSLPNNVTVAVSLRTDRGGRSFRGRSYFIGMSLAATDRNRLQAATQAGLVANYSGLLTALVEGSGFALGVLSLRASNAWRSTGVWTEVTHVTCNLGLDSQRRRLDKGH